MPFTSTFVVGAERLEPVPESASDAVHARLASLSSGAQEAAEIAAAAGSRVSLDVSSEVAGSGTAVEELFEAGLLIEAGDPPSHR
jgi:hypothetical protein